MRGLIILFACYLGLVTTDVEASDKIEVIIFAGQSNMVGKGLIKNAPTGYYPMSKNIEFHSWGSNSRMEDFADNFGPELSFAKILVALNPKKKYIFIKWAVGGTSQAEWSPMWRLQEMENQARAKKLGSLYKKSLSFIRKSIAGRDVEITSMFWMQGEADTKGETVAGNYAKNMEQLIAAFRKDLKAPRLKVVMGLVNPEQDKYAYVDIVQSQMKLLASKSFLVGVVSAEGLSKLKDKVHYDETGLIGLGERFVEKWQEMQTSNEF